jgi:hypothetical protein
MQPGLTFAGQVLAVVILVLAYYGLVVQRIGDYPARFLLPIAIDRFHAAQRYSADELDSMLRLFIAGVMQLIFCCILIMVAGIDPMNLIPHNFEPVLVVYGMLLGIAESAVGSFLAYLGIQIAVKIDPKSVPCDESAWLTISRGGWIRFFIKTSEAAPIWLALLLATLYVSVEEIVFRGVLIDFLKQGGVMVALGGSVALFVVVQVFNMPSRYSAMFPVLGAVVIGIVHGSMYLAVPNLLPLIIAHMIFFVWSVL